jgi:hypothetical protein
MGEGRWKTSAGPEGAEMGWFLEYPVHVFALNRTEGSAKEKACQA